MVNAFLLTAGDARQGEDSLDTDCCSSQLGSGSLQD